MSISPLVLVSSAKGERRTLKAGFKQLGKHLRTSRCEVSRLDAAAGIRGETLAGAALVIFGCPTRPFTLEELQSLKTFLERGGSMLVLASAGGEVANGSNLNYLLEEFGMAVADDSVIQSAFTKYMHPKQVLVDEGVLSPDMAAFCSNVSGAGASQQQGAAAPPPTDQNGRPVVEFVYPHGATVVVQEPAVAILSSGRVAHPYNMAVGAAWWGREAGADSAAHASSADAELPGHPGATSGRPAGRLVVLGSCAMLDDEWLPRERNSAVMEYLLGWLLRDPGCRLSARNLAEPEFLDLRPVTHLEELAAQPKVMLELPPPLPADITTLFSTTLCKLDLSLVPEVGRLYQRLGVPRRRVALWRPDLDVPFPPLQPAVFPPMLHEPPPPALELFDLEEEFAGPLERLSRITARYVGQPLSGEQLEGYVRECGTLLGLRSAAAGEGAKAQLAEVLEAVVQCKMPDACV